MAKKRKETVDLSVEEIEERLVQIEADKHALEAALEKQRTAELARFAAEIRDQIRERGYSLDEVFGLLSNRGLRTLGRRRAGFYPRYVDPQNPVNTYSRGPVPVWLREKMIAKGYDPQSKAQRDAFKSTHLEQAA
jgi:DNA-binding protein H-NS